MTYNNILQTIGNTPLVRIYKLNKKNQVNIFAKIEGQNQGGSIKDRIAFIVFIDVYEVVLLHTTR